MEVVVFILVNFVVVFLVIRPIISFLHELGHALPALLFTKSPVQIFIGSYGSTDNSIRLRIGLLQVYFIKDVLSWSKGVCISSKSPSSFVATFIFIIGGALLNLVVGVSFIYIAFHFELHGAIQYLAVIYGGFSILDFLGNLLPSYKLIHLDNEKRTNNDGYQLMELINNKSSFTTYNTAVNLFQNKEYIEAGKIFESILKLNNQYENAFRFAVASYYNVKDYSKASQLYAHYSANFRLTLNDYLVKGYIKTELKFFQESIEEYTKAIELNPQNSHAYNNRGYSYTLMEEYDAAIIDLTKAISLDPTFAFPYNNLGYAKIKLGRLEEGLTDINHSLKLDASNSYAYRNIGIYHLNKRNFHEALTFFSKAKELNPGTLEIDAYIEKAQKEIV